MIRILTLAALGFAIAFSGMVVSGSMSGAEAKKYRSVRCHKTTVAGKVKKWRCKRGQFCCSAPIIGYFGCGTKGLGCFGKW